MWDHCNFACWLAIRRHHLFHSYMIASREVTPALTGEISTFPIAVANSLCSSKESEEHHTFPIVLVRRSWRQHDHIHIVWLNGLCLRNLAVLIRIPGERAYLQNPTSFTHFPAISQPNFWLSEFICLRENAKSLTVEIYLNFLLQLEISSDEGDGSYTYLNYFLF